VPAGGVEAPRRLIQRQGILRSARCAPGHSGRAAYRICSAPSDRREGAMRAYVETIGIIFGLMGAYFALLPLMT
jgi:hypothetical protein